MKLRVRIAEGEPAELHVVKEQGLYNFRLGPGPERKASVEAVESGIYSVLIDGRSYEVKIVPGPGNWFVDIRGVRLAVEVTDPRDSGFTADAVISNGPQKLASLMPGKVVRVLVAEGDSVEAGQGLVVVEAMKMQNEIKAPKPGRVFKMLAREGATVSAGEVLAMIE
jgi:biotin carboxyl carrier protein